MYTDVYRCIEMYRDTSTYIQLWMVPMRSVPVAESISASHYNTHFNTLQHTATHFNILQHTLIMDGPDAVCFFSQHDSCSCDMTHSDVT